MNPPASIQTQVMVLDEPKKHSVRYNASSNDQQPMLTSVYISKRNLPHTPPRKITVAIQPYLED